MKQKMKKALMAQALKTMQGATIHQLNMFIESGAKVVYKESAAPMPTPASAYTDDMIARAIIELNGKEKPLCEKQLFLAVIKVLMAKCDWIGKWQSCCDRINALPAIKATELEVKCDYNNLKAPSALKFASMQYEEWETYEPTAIERDVFLKNKHLGHLFEEALDRQLQAQH